MCCDDSADNQLFFQTTIKPNKLHETAVFEARYLRDAGVCCERSQPASCVNQQIYRTEVSRRRARSTTRDLDGGHDGAVPHCQIDRLCVTSGDEKHCRGKTVGRSGPPGILQGPLLKTDRKRVLRFRPKTKTKTKLSISNENTFNM